MTYKEFFLEDEFPGLPDVGVKTKATLYVPELSREIDPERRHACVVICPGGGYCFTSDREAEPLALRLLGYGVASLVVRYAINPVRYPMQLLQVSAAVALARRKADEWHLDPQNITVMGFSAGGHAAAAAGILWDEDCIPAYLGIQKGENRPDGMILAYPVITSGPKAHRGSIVSLLGEFSNPVLLDKVSLEKQVKENTPPAFIWHTRDDACVPVENSLMLMTALAEKGIGFEAHIYPHGEHGLSLSDYTTDKTPKNTDVRNWIDMAIRWIKNR